MDPNYDPRERSWYIDAMENKGEIIITDPYVAAGTDDLVITVSKATEDGSGVVAVSVHLNHLQNLSNSMEIGREGYAIILDNTRKYIAHPKIKGGTEATERFFEKLYEKESGNFSYTFEGDPKRMYFVTNKTTGWKIGVLSMMKSLVKLPLNLPNNNCCVGYSNFTWSNYCIRYNPFYY